MESGRHDADVVEIDLGEVVALLWHRAWLVILAALLAAASGYCLSRYVVAEKFESTTKVYILNKESNGGTLTYSDVQLGSQLTKDYAQIIKSRHVLEQVITNCGLEESYEHFSKRINVEVPTDTRMIYITVTDEDPSMAQYLANEIRKVASAHIENVMDIQAVNVVDEANFPIQPASPSIGKWTLIGALIGAFVCVAIVLVHFILDDTIKTSEDVEKYLGLSTLALIPERENQKKKHKKNKHRDSRYAAKRRYQDYRRNTSRSQLVLEQQYGPSQNAVLHSNLDDWDIDVEGDLEEFDI